MAKEDLTKIEGDYYCTKGRVGLIVRNGHWHIANLKKAINSGIEECRMSSSPREEECPNTCNFKVLQTKLDEIKPTSITTNAPQIVVHHPNNNLHLW